ARVPSPPRSTPPPAEHMKRGPDIGPTLFRLAPSLRQLAVGSSWRAIEGRRVDRGAGEGPTARLLSRVLALVDGAGGGCANGRVQAVVVDGDARQRERAALRLDLVVAVVDRGGVERPAAGDVGDGKNHPDADRRDDDCGEEGLPKPDLPTGSGRRTRVC